ncbi:hypothetical protein B0T14DRAFT_511022 [Immersiella caudata]|uniref:Secreted protein n=1 Tax=Immersiella caudata TaxID=314043 RepID=A0AA40C7A6_9PEZI|nr:hypothetical protein B0T14DRAFT_511022 [Immersiella caudata]
MIALFPFASSSFVFACVEAAKCPVTTSCRRVRLRRVENLRRAHPARPTCLGIFQGCGRGLVQRNAGRPKIKLLGTSSRSEGSCRTAPQ